MGEGDVLSSIFLVSFWLAKVRSGKFSTNAEEGAGWKSLLAYEMRKRGVHRGVPVGGEFLCKLTPHDCQPGNFYLAAKRLGSNGKPVTSPAFPDT